MQVIGVFIKFVLLYTPFFVTSVFLTSTSEMEQRDRRRLAIRTAFAVMVISALLFLFGNVIFNCLGISLDAFRIGAGLVLLLNGIEMVRSSGIPPTRQCGADNDIAVVPLAIPVTAGPGTIGALLVMGAETMSYGERTLELLMILAAASVVGAMLYYSDVLDRVLKRKGITILSKLTGMYLVALAAQIIFTGVANFLKL